MSYYYGYGKRHMKKFHYSSVNYNSGLKKEVDLLEKQLKELSLGSTFKTVFEINLKTATKTIHNSRCVEARSATQGGKYVLSQDDSTVAPTYGADYVENKAANFNFMIFCCPELMFPDISIFVVSETSDTDGYGTWRYIIGNDDGNYDKFISYKVLSYNKIIHGGGTKSSGKYIDELSVFSIMGKKNILSCHWFQKGSCVYSDGNYVIGSGFNANMKHIGNPYGSIFYNERFDGSISSSNREVLVGKIYGFKIVQGLLTATDIKKIHQDMKKEYAI